MGDKSGIEWTDATWNPVVGCTRVSAGCDHCYAFQLHDQRHIAWKRGRFPDAPKQYHQPFSKVQLIPERLVQPFRWRKPRRIFVNSLSDLFHDAVPDEYIDRVFAVMALAPQHTFQILTKRPERMAAYFGTGRPWQRVSGRMYERYEYTGFAGDVYERENWPLWNVWLGTSVENQQAADERIPWLLKTPAAVRFLSCEPLLGPVDLTAFVPLPDQDGHCSQCGLEFEDPRGLIHCCPPVFGSSEIHWVIGGGESGPHARPFDVQWARDLRDQCAATGIAFLWKQNGGRTAKAGGRLLDGVEWNQYPEVSRVG